ncbi:MAG: biotin transporter BioY [Planctomycetota bacterium]
MRTYADLICPSAVRRDAMIRDIALILAGSALVALCAKIQLPVLPVPVTMQPFAVLLVGATLGSRRGALALGAYLVQGAMGLPVFAFPSAGLTYLAGPTAGYLLAFPVAAFVVGRLAECGWDRRFGTAVAALALGQAVILALGFAWLTFFVGVERGFATGVAPFLLGDALKVLLAAAALPAGWCLVRRVEGREGVGGEQ